MALKTSIALMWRSLGIWDAGFASPTLRLLLGFGHGRFTSVQRQQSNTKELLGLHRVCVCLICHQIPVGAESNNQKTEISENLVPSVSISQD